MPGALTVAPDVRTSGTYAVAKRKAIPKVRTPATPKDDGERLHIRIPPELKGVAREMAAEDNRSVSNLVLTILRDEAKRRGKLN